MPDGFCDSQGGGVVRHLAWHERYHCGRPKRVADARVLARVVLTPDHGTARRRVQRLIGIAALEPQEVAGAGSTSLFGGRLSWRGCGVTQHRVRNFFFPKVTLLTDRTPKHGYHSSPQHRAAFLRPQLSLPPAGAPTPP